MKKCKRSIKLRDVCVYWECDVSNQNTRDAVYAIFREFRKKSELPVGFFSSKNRALVALFSDDDDASIVLAEAIEETIKDKKSVRYFFNLPPIP